MREKRIEEGDIFDEIGIACVWQVQIGGDDVLDLETFVDIEQIEKAVEEQPGGNEARGTESSFERDE